MLDASKSDELRFTFDIKQAARSEHAVWEYVDMFASLEPHRLVNLHICDYVRDGMRVGAALPGKGQCDFEKLGKALRNMKYEGPAILELYSDLYENDEEFRECYDFVKRTVCL